MVVRCACARRRYPANANRCTHKSIGVRGVRIDALPCDNDVVAREIDAFPAANDVFPAGIDVFAKCNDVFPKGIDVFSVGNDVFSNDINHNDGCRTCSTRIRAGKRG